MERQLELYLIYSPLALLVNPLLVASLALPVARFARAAEGVLRLGLMGLLAVWIGAAFKGKSGDYGQLTRPRSTVHSKTTVYTTHCEDDGDAGIAGLRISSSSDDSGLSLRSDGSYVDVSLSMNWGDDLGDDTLLSGVTVVSSPSRGEEQILVGRREEIDFDTSQCVGEEEEEEKDTEWTRDTTVGSVR